MVRDPAVFLFDEPLSNLDAQLRTQMRLEIKKLHQRVGNTIIFVTHDQVEAMTMADRIVIMKDGPYSASGHAGRGLSQACEYVCGAVYRGSFDEHAVRDGDEWRAANGVGEHA